MEVITEKKQIQKLADEYRIQGKRIGLVPTMGALHVAHANLIKKAGSQNDIVIVTVFVNPAQFGPNEDFSTYPRTFEEDKKLCEDEGADIIFCPEAAAMYSADSSTSVRVTDLTDTMCGETRTGHFEGVATIVSKLFNICKPHMAYFGQKDYQQFRVIQRMVRDLDYDIELIMCPTVREEDGLAVSSRNRYLDQTQRNQAAGIYNTLKETGEFIKSGERNTVTLGMGMKKSIEKSMPGCRIDYAGVYDAYSLKVPEMISGRIVIAAAVWLGSARLIDNILMEI